MDFFAPGIATSSSRGFNTSGPKKVPVELLNAERQKQANCFTVAWDGTVQEGISLSIDHPVATCKLTLVFGGGGYMKTDDINRPLYERSGADALVRRASIKLVENLRTGKDLPLLERLRDDAPDYHLVLVDKTTPLTVRFGVRLYAGVDRTADILMWSDSDVFVRVGKLDVLDIYLPDGRIARFDYKTLPGMKPEIFSPWETLEKRMNLVENNLEKAATLPAEVSAKVVNRWFFELANMLRLTRLLPDPEARKPLILLVGKYARKFFGGALTGNLHGNFFQALKSVGEDRMPWWISGEDNSFSMIDHLGATERKGPPKAVQVRKTARSQRDRIDRASKKTPSSGGGQQGKQKSSKKK